MNKRPVILSVPQDATISSIASGLKDPIEYVRRVLERMYELRRMESDIELRIGIRSGKDHPNYMFATWIEDDDYRQSIPIAAYSGRTHKEMKINDETFWKDWSYTASSLEDLKTLLGTLRRSLA